MLNLLPRRALVAVVLLGVAVATGRTTGAGQSVSPEPCYRPVPRYFAPLTEAIWGDRGPWVLVGGRPSRAAVLRVDVTHVSGSIGIRLDTIPATVRLEPGPCQPGGPCEGVCQPQESYWVELIDDAGSRLARKNLCAPYNWLEIVPVDLVNGPGDELLVIRSTGHASPPTGNQLDIWALDSDARIADIGKYWVSGPFASLPFGSARWRSQLHIDVSQPKPRPIRLTTRFGAKPGSQLCDSERLARVRGTRQLRFDRVLGSYLPRW